MQPKQYSKIIVLVICLIWVAASPAKGDNCGEDGIQIVSVQSTESVCPLNEL